MAGRGAAPKTAGRRGRVPLTRGDWKPAHGVGWQFDPLPKPPDGLLVASRIAWDTWFRAWFAAHWTPDDIPGLRQVIRIYDQMERGQFQMRSELRLAMDGYGMTPKGQQDRRWTPPSDAEAPAKTGSAHPYAHLRAVK